ncbi:MAG: hemerythrin domain-containing protein [Deltaproteobacteria bacterium]|nr:hemerythrin domain-containing protein [Deltaproteobacteria bacterium]
MPRISDPLELLTQQHDDLFALLDALSSPNEAERTRALDNLANELPDHLAAEQELLYPCVTGYLAQPVREELLAEHAEIKRALADLLWFGLDDADAPRRIAELRTLLEGHAAYQDHELFENAAESLQPLDITILGNRLHAWFLAPIDTARAA